jgi:hypothetical protein
MERKNSVVKIWPLLIGGYALEFFSSFIFMHDENEKQRHWKLKANNPAVLKIILLSGQAFCPPNHSLNVIALLLSFSSFPYVFLTHTYTCL